MIQKFEVAATGATHAAVDATLMDVLNPTVPLADSTGNLLRVGVYGVGAWLARGYRDNKSFGF